MLILGLESSCDETGAAIILGKSKSQQVKILSNVIASSLAMHSKTGGIIPENAAREQIKFIIPVIENALKKAQVNLEEIDALAVTHGPGLIGSLLIGVETAKTLAYIYNKPLIPTNHLIGHIYANWIENSPQLPAIGLIISGAHTDLILIEKHGKIKWLGGTRDDAAGECFDKCARLLGYDYPGGPKIAKLAELGDPNKYSLPRPMMNDKSFEFSFSGLKTAFINATKEHFSVLRNNPSSVGWQQIALEDKLEESEKQILYDLCASLEQAIADVIIKKTIRATQSYDVKSVLMGGGVAANKRLREQLKAKLDNSNTKLYYPPVNLCVDNGAMIATAAYFNNQPVDWKKVEADPSLYF